MTINTISTLSGTQQQQGIKNADAQLQAAIASIVTGSKSTDVATVALASQLQSQTSGLKQLSSNLAQGVSLTQVADGGAEQILNSLSQLQTLAQQAQSPTLNADTRQQLNQQVQQLVNQVDQLATGTTFNGQNLLNGSLSGNNGLSLDTLLSSNGGNNGATSDLSISSLTSSSLFGGQSLDISSADTAGQALNSITDALNQVLGTRANIGAFQQTLNFAAANVDSALVNQEAAQSALSETDIAAAATNASQSDLKLNADIALAAQGNRLSPTLLKLIG